MRGTPLECTGEGALGDVGELEEGEDEVLEGVGLDEEGLEVVVLEELVDAGPLEGELDEVVVLDMLVDAGPLEGEPGDVDEGLEGDDVPNIPHGELYRDVTSVWLRKRLQSHAPPR